MPHAFRINSFFAGIGGFDLGFSEAGFRPSFLCENDPFCISVLSARLKDVPRKGDIANVQPDAIPEADVWAGGFPCQDVSVARSPHGRDGLKGARSGLFFRFLELIEARKPPVVLLENVTGLLNSHKGRDFGTIVESLTALGYGVAWRILNARYFGIPQSRPRIYVCAWFNSPESAISALYEKRPSSKPAKERIGFLTPCRPNSSGAIVPQIAYCLAATSGRHTGMDWSRSYVSYPSDVRRLTPLEYERLQGFPDGWSMPEESGGLDGDDLDTLRYQALGNAVCVPVVTWVARRIRARLVAQASGSLREILPVNGSTPKWLAKQLPSRPDDDVRSCALHIPDNNEKFSWGSGGCAVNGCFADFSAPSGPMKSRPSSLGKLIEKSRPGIKYFLSPNAANGIVRRVRKNGRTLFPPLQAALDALRVK